MPENYFGEKVAERYDDSSDDMFDPAVVASPAERECDAAGTDAELEDGPGAGEIS